MRKITAVSPEFRLTHTYDVIRFYWVYITRRRNASPTRECTYQRPQRPQLSRQPAEYVRLMSEGKQE
jgi:hypothetical protein